MSHNILHYERHFLIIKLPLLMKEKPFDSTLSMTPRRFLDIILACNIYVCRVAVRILLYPSPSVPKIIRISTQKNLACHGICNSILVQMSGFYLHTVDLQLQLLRVHRDGVTGSAFSEIYVVFETVYLSVLIVHAIRGIQRM